MMRRSSTYAWRGYVVIPDTHAAFHYKNIRDIIRDIKSVLSREITFDIKDSKGNRIIGMGSTPHHLSPAFANADDDKRMYLNELQLHRCIERLVDKLIELAPEEEKKVIDIGKTPVSDQLSVYF
jgi:hypothetical protein